MVTNAGGFSATFIDYTIPTNYLGDDPYITGIFLFEIENVLISGITFRNYNPYDMKRSLFNIYGIIEEGTLEFRECVFIGLGKLDSSSRHANDDWYYSYINNERITGQHPTFASDQLVDADPYLRGHNVFHFRELGNRGKIVIHTSSFQENNFLLFNGTGEVQVVGTYNKK